MIAIILFVLILVVASGYVCYKWGYNDGVKAGEWESVIARADKINANPASKELNL